MYNYENSIEDLSAVLGKTPVRVWQTDRDELFIKFSDGYVLLMKHDQDCCETVVIEDVTGDWGDLLGTPLLVADVRTREENPNTAADNGLWSDSSTWTFYTFRGNRGSVDVRWYGSSNGYYSEQVDMYLFYDNNTETQ